MNLPEHSAGRTPLLEAIHQYYNQAAKLLIDSGTVVLTRHAQNGLFGLHSDLGTCLI